MSGPNAGRCPDSGVHGGESFTTSPVVVMCMEHLALTIVTSTTASVRMRSEPMLWEVARVGSGQVTGKQGS